MAKKTYSIETIAESTMNGFESYRVEVAGDVFTLNPQTRNGRVYFYTVKRVRNKLHKAYVGRAGLITRETLKAACLKAISKESDWSQNYKTKRRNLHGYN